MKFVICYIYERESNLTLPEPTQSIQIISRNDLKHHLETNNATILIIQENNTSMAHRRHICEVTAAYNCIITAVIQQSPPELWVYPDYSNIEQPPPYSESESEVSTGSSSGVYSAYSEYHEEPAGLPPYKENEEVGFQPFDGSEEPDKRFTILEMLEMDEWVGTEEIEAFYALYQMRVKGSQWYLS
ncbi:hypothetical protein FT663_03956 [Candidozyma haemuli var. vulneris]|uniref:Uncharacterized protein n=1 Tax=Candidozyma haemuli TaxID=45357 RepID=A0A2V1AV81_9ASCO|nr:hypothetical protein CXQ85_000687 [[Candida] haemuloni]KAF3987395.1 hypothetical protein FT662_04010 [[Candida] haemuloni var. vulneris]KAF3988600.1 hypothetical protein FT663_03956 [[Candida] haemuloni var. vulneris]PVH21699.1 hypothetical protein CXQ85_000687 [[Candida] haemuloni]